MTDFKFDNRQGHVRSGWNVTAMLIRGRLTDKKIAAYERRGWYSAEYRSARRELMEKKKVRREGNFSLREGRMIYSPGR